MASAQLAPDAPSSQPEAPEAMAISSTSLLRGDGQYELTVYTGASAGSSDDGIGSMNDRSGGGGEIEKTAVAAAAAAGIDRGGGGVVKSYRARRRSQRHGQQRNRRR